MTSHRPYVVWAKERLERGGFSVPFQNTILSSLTVFAGSRTSEQPTRILAFSRHADLHSAATHA
jgi:hypothetical protein